MLKARSRTNGLAAAAIGLIALGNGSVLFAAGDLRLLEAVQRQDSGACGRC